MHSDFGGTVNTMRKAFALTLAVAMVFTNSILAGETLVRDSIQSEGYVTGSTGWSINRDGTAEFSDIVSRGSLIAGPNPGQHIEINGDQYPGEIAFFSGSADEQIPGRIFPNDPGGNVGAVTMRSPNLFDDVQSNVAEISLEGFDDGFTVASIEADAARLTASGEVRFVGDTVKMGQFTPDLDLVVRLNDTSTFVVIENEDETWNNIARVNSWVDFAGARANYFIDATGRVQLRGQVASGSAALIGTLPVGYRPTQTMEWIMRGVGGVVMCAVSVSTAGAITVTANLATAQASGIKLDAISFPTF